MPFFVISIALQVAFVIHVLKTGRNTMWIWIIVMLPLAGTIAYLIMEVIPDLTNSKKGRSAARKIQESINPNKHLNQAVSDLAQSDTVENSLNLADELVGKGLYSEAQNLYARCLKGFHEYDPAIMSKLGLVEFELGNYKETKEILDTLIEKNPNYKNEDSHLLYARTLEALGQLTEAISEFEVLVNYYSGPQATFFYALLKRSMGNTDEAKALLSSIIDKAKLSGAHYNSLNKDWIAKAKKELNSIT